MGVTAELRPNNPNADPGVLAAVSRLVNELQYLSRVWEDSFDGSAAVEIIKGFASGSGYNSVGDLAKNPNFKDKKPDFDYFTSVAIGNQMEYTFFPLKGGSVQLVVKPDRFGNSAIRCPACLEPVGKKPAVAHSIIPQNIWKKLIRGACEDFLLIVANGSLVGKAGVKTFTTLSKQPSNKELDKKFDLSAPVNSKFIDKLLNDTSIMSTYAAQDNAMKQCLKCETGQADASLLQRLKIVIAGDLPASFKFEGGIHNYTETSFVGRKLIDDAIQMKAAERASGIQGEQSLNEMFKRKTISQLSRYLLGIEKAMGEYLKDLKNLPDDCPLLALMFDHWDEFCWCFRTRGLLEAGKKYDGQIKA